jgi:two-component system nitrogen regulation sensor histidine kinase GlnL
MRISQLDLQGQSMQPDTMQGHSYDTEQDEGGKLLDVLPHAILSLALDGSIVEVNAAAESFFGISRATLRHQNLAHFLPPGSPLFSLIDQVMTRGSAITEYRVDLGSPWAVGERIVDIFVSPLAEGDEGIVIMLQERTMTEKLDRQLTRKGAARSVSALASMLAHEIKNPLSGIRGAAQLLEAEASDSDRALTQLICEETDRIVKLVDRMETFSDERPIARESVNIHAVIDHVKKVSQAGFARHIRFIENYDPSLPQVLGNRDQLIQVFLNLVKNAAEAIGEATDEGEIELSTAFRPGVRLKTSESAPPVSLPLEFCVRDNGPGISPEVLPHLFDPFITTKATGTGLGLALVAKIIGDHGGIIECESHLRRTTFRVLMPMYAPRDGRSTKLD